MAKHNDKEFNETIKNHITHSLKERQDYGVAQGLFAACKVIKERATNEELSAEDRIAGIIDFCDTVINHAQKSDHPGDKT